MVINTNLEAQRTAANLATSYAALSKSLSRLSSGSKIVSPADDAAGLAVSSRMQSVKQRLEAAMTNISGAVSITQTQDGYMKSLSQALIRMSELSLLAQDASKTDTDRALYDKEFQQLKDYVESTSVKDFNGVPLFGGQSMNIIIDADGSGFNIPGINMKDDVYANAISDQLWELNQQVWKTSKDGFKLETDAWKLSQDTWKLGVDAWKLNQDMWYNNNTDIWSDTDLIDGSVKYDRDYYIHIDGVNILSAPPLVASEDIPPLVASKDIEDGFSVRGSTLSTEDMDFDTARTGINLDANKDISGFKVTQAAPPEQSGIQMGGERHSGIAVDQATSVWTLGGDIFDDNDIVKFEDGFPTATPPLDTNTLYYTKKIDASTFELYYDSGLTQKIDIQSTGESGSYTLTEFSMDLKKTDHGYVNGDMVTFSQGTPENIDEGDTYYVRKSDDDTFTLHTTLTDAQSGNNPLLFDYTDSQFTLEKLSNTVVTLAKHGFQDEEQVTFRDSAPGGATVGTPYFVKKIDDNTFTLHATQENAEDNVNPITLATRWGTSTSWSGVNLDSSVLEGIAADATTNIWTKASHGLEQGDTIQIKEGDLTQLSGISGDVAYVRVIDENTFTLHSTPSGAQPLPSGLVAHYPLDGNANDASGNGLNGTVVGGASSGTDRTGTANSAYDLDGVDDYINIGNDPQLALDKYTVGAWFKHDSDHPSEIYRTLIAKGEGVHAHQMNYMLLVGNDTGQLGGGIGHGGSLSDPGPTSLSSGIPVDDGQWHHAALSFDSDTGEAALYLDGALVDSKSGQLPAHTNAGTDANIGIWRDPVYGEWDGGVDDVQIYDRALSAAEIKQIHQIGVINDNPIDVLQTGTYSLAEDPQVLKLDGHNFKAGDQVKFTSNAPAGAEVGKAYYVGGINGDNFALYKNLDDATNSNTSNGTEILLDPAAAQFTLEQLNREFLMQGTERAELLKLANHGYQSGEKIHFDGAVPDTMPPVTSNPDGAGAWYYVHKVDQDNFTLHSSEADALSGTGSIKFNNSTTTFDLEGDRYTDYVRMSADKPGHGYVTGDRVMVDPSVPAGTTPPLNAGTPYFIGAQDERTYSIHTTLEDAQNGINAVQWDLAVIDVENIGAIEYLITKDTANITREAHGYNTGAAVMFSDTAPGGADNTTAYYVNSADADNFTLHNSLEDAQNGVNAVNLNHAETESYSLLPAVLITKEAHGYNTGATVLLSGTTPGGADSTTMYYVNSTDADNFTLHNSLEDAQNSANAVSLNQTSYSLLSTTLPSTAYSSGDYVFDNVVTNGTLAYTDATTHLAGTFTTTDLISDGLSSDKAKTFTSGAFIATDPVGLGDISESQRVAISAGTFVTVNPIDSGEDANAKVYESGAKISSSEDLAGFGTNLGSVRLTDIENAKSALALINASVERITMDRASLGAILSRMQYTSDQITEHKMNLSAAISRITDVDVAEEATNYARQQILVQSGTQMLGQANDLPRAILELLRR